MIPRACFPNGKSRDPQYTRTSSQRACAMDRSVTVTGLHFAYDN